MKIPKIFMNVKKSDNQYFVSFKSWSIPIIKFMFFIEDIENKFYLWLLKR